MRCFFISLLFFVVVQCRVYETEDAIVVTAVDDGDVSSRTEDTEEQPRTNGFWRLPADNQESVIVRALTANEAKRPPRPTKVEFNDRSCLTFDRKAGVCKPVHECYPYTKAHQTLSNLETWVIGTLGTCNYVEPQGRQVYGVCCGVSKPENRTSKSTERNMVETTTNFPDALSRIVGGTSSYTGEYPFMVGIMSNGKVYCGGSLLDDIHVLTAAHCVSRLSSRGVAQLQVILGAASLNDPSMIVKRVYSITRHRNFDESKLYNDIALLTLDSPVKFGNTIAPVCLYDDQGIVHDDKDAIAIGWGNLKDGGPRAEILQKVSVQIKNQEDCKNNFGSRAPGGIVDHFLCAWAPKKDSCAGDSGGPLMATRGDRLCQVGIVSWGIGCATDTYGVYTRISSFDIWINRNRIRF